MQPLLSLSKTLREKPYCKKVGTCAILLCFLLLTFWIRIQGVESIPQGLFTETDAYLYYKQAHTIAEHGHLPARDMQRWLPLGRDNGQLLSLYAYAIAYTHKVFPWFSLYDIQLYAPTVCFTIGLSVLLLFLTRTYGILFAAIVGGLLATLPGSIERSAAGFGDRDAWCWMLGTLAVVSYLWKEQMDLGYRRWIATVLSGFIVFLGGMSWEAFGVFVLMIVAVELYKFCSTDTEQHLSEYLLWILMFVPWLYLISPAYRNGYGFAKHLFALTIAPSLAVFALRGARSLLLQYFETIRPHARKLACGLTLLGIATSINYFFLNADSLATTTFAFHENRLMKSVSELSNPNTQYWVARYGTIFGLGSIGLVFGCNTLWTRNSILDTVLNLLLSLLLFAFIWTSFLPENSTTRISINGNESLSLILLALITIFLGIAASRNTAYVHKQSIFFMVLVWFLLWGSLATRGKRYDFFTGIPFAFGTAWLLWQPPKHIIQRLKDLNILNPHANERLVTSCITIALFLSICFYVPLGGHATRAVPAATQMRSPIPRQVHIIETFKWIKSEIPNAVLASLWDFGTQLNVFSGVKTITDPDHFIPHWIPLYYRHVLYTQDEQEALEFLKTHNATHLMLTDTEVIRKSEDFSYVGSNSHNDRHFKMYHIVAENRPIGASYRLRPHHTHETPLAFIDIAPTPSKQLSVSIQLKDGKTIDKKVAYEPGKQKQKAVAFENSGVILYFNTENQLYNAYWVPPIGWNSLAVKLFLRREHSTAFRPIYPTNGDTTAKVKIWEIHYPPNIKTNEKYLATEPEYTHNHEH